MAWARVQDNVAVELPPGPLVIDDVQYTSDIFALAVQNEAGWSLAALAALGVYPVEETGIPDWKQSVSNSLVFENGQVTRVHTTEFIPLADRKAGMKQAVNTTRDQVMQSGFEYDFGVVHRLQTRFQDETSWLALKDACNDAIMAGMGAEQSALPMRTAENVEIQLTYNEVAECLRAMRVKQSQRLGYSWALKNAIDAAADHAALDAINTAAGWPE